MKSICVYCASSRRCEVEYFEAAQALGREIARERLTLYYGGGGVGLMGALANTILEEGGRVVGVIPRFMYEVEWAHTGITELRVVDDMHARKKMMIEESDALVALPGGCGTLEELFEAITWKRLGLHTKPIVLVNVRGFFDPCVELLQRCIDERFMRPEHGRMWSVVNSPVAVIDAARRAPGWDKNAIEFAGV